MLAKLKYQLKINGQHTIQTIQKMDQIGRHQMQLYSFFKNYICKHAVGMAIRLKYCKPPAAAKIVPVCEKRKRGRPAKAKPALLVTYNKSIIVSFFSFFKLH